MLAFTQHLRLMSYSNDRLMKALRKTRPWKQYDSQCVRRHRKAPGWMKSNLSWRERRWIEPNLCLEHWFDDSPPVLYELNEAVDQHDFDKYRFPEVCSGFLCGGIDLVDSIRCSYLVLTLYGVVGPWRIALSYYRGSTVTFPTEGRAGTVQQWKNPVENDLHYWCWISVPCMMKGTLYASSRNSFQRYREDPRSGYWLWECECSAYATEWKRWRLQESTRIWGRGQKYWQARDIVGALISPCTLQGWIIAYGHSPKVSSYS